MPGFMNLREYVSTYAAETARTHYSYFRKASSTGSLLNGWADIVPGTGNPRSLIYTDTPLRGVPISASTYPGRGINHGPSVSPSFKYLHRFMMLYDNTASLPLTYILADYLKFYPFVDASISSPQVMDNTLALPRYATGEGVRAMVVMQAPNGGANAFVQMTYTNSDGVTGRLSQIERFGPANSNGTGLMPLCVTISEVSARPFIGLAAGDKGVRAVESIQMTTGTDVGLFAVVLVRPLMTGSILDPDSPAEIMPAVDQNNFIRIYDDAFLGFMATEQGQLQRVFNGEIETIWN